MYLKKIPPLLQRYYHRYTWRIETEEPVLYLTFDDGPTPEISRWVMDQLDAYDAKATFFWVGNNIPGQVELAHETIDRRHHIGNHTQNHKDGFTTPLRTYLRDFLRCQQTIFEYTGKRTQLFRPPYGRLTHTKAKYIQRTHRIIMMDVISGDFDTDLDADACLETVIEKAQPGSIVLLHDSVKAWPRLEAMLPRLLAYYSNLGYRFLPIPLQSSRPSPPSLASQHNWEF